METTTPTIPPLTQMSARGQITLPASIRKKLHLRTGEPLLVTIEDGCIVLQPAVVTPVEIYTDERIAEFEAAASMTDEELAAARRRWGLDPEP